MPTFEEKIKNCFAEFEIDSEDQEECLELILKKDESYVKKTKKKRRDSFKQRVDQILAQYPPVNLHQSLTLE